jgi:NADPH:quinone reductase-like Zn-dependent oxidoreductase
VIQNAANSAVGAYVVQLAKHRGLRTVNVVRRESAVAGVRGIGGDVVLVDGEHLRSRVREATGETPIKLAMDAVGGMATDRIAACLGKGGILVNYGAMSGEPCSISPRSFIFNDVTLKGFWLAPWLRAAPREKQMALFAELVGLVARGVLHAPIQATYTVAEIKQAVAAAHQGERGGKVLVVAEALRSA